MDGWNTSFPLGWPSFRCYVSFRECKRHEYFMISQPLHSSTPSVANPKNPNLTERTPGCKDDTIGPGGLFRRQQKKRKECSSTMARCPAIEIHLGVCLLSWNYTMYVDKYRYSYGYKMYLVKPNNNSQPELRLLLQTFRLKTTSKVSATEAVLVCPDILQSVHIIAIYCLIEYQHLWTEATACPDFFGFSVHYLPDICADSI